MEDKDKENKQEPNKEEPSKEQGTQQGKEEQQSLARMDAIDARIDLMAKQQDAIIAMLITNQQGNKEDHTKIKWE